MSGFYNPQILSVPMLEYAWVLLHVDSAAGLLLDRSLKGLFKTRNEELLAAKVSNHLAEDLDCNPFS